MLVTSGAAFSYPYLITLSQILQHFKARFNERFFTSSPLDLGNKKLPSFVCGRPIPLGCGVTDEIEKCPSFRYAICDCKLIILILFYVDKENAVELVSEIVNIL